MTTLAGIESEMISVRMIELDWLQKLTSDAAQWTVLVILKIDNSNIITLVCE